jgi:outer membrane protein TolC
MTLAKAIFLVALAALTAGRAGAANSAQQTAPAAPATPAAAGSVATSKLPADIDLSKPLSLVDCARVALVLNPGLAVAGQQVIQAKDTAIQAKAALLPNLTAGADVISSQNLTSGAIGGTGGSFANSGRSTDRDLSLQLSETFFQSGVPQTIAAARASLLASRWGFNDARRTLLLQVAQSYYDVLAAVALVGVDQQAVKDDTAHLDEANARIEAGTAAKSDRYPFDVALQQALVQAISAVNQLTLSTNALKQILGLPASSPLQVAESLGRPPAPANVEDLLAAASQNRPDILQGKAQVEAARQTAKAADIQRGPILVANAADNYGIHTDLTGNSWQVEAGVSMPIFDAGVTRAAAESAGAAEKIAQADLRLVELEASQDVENNFATAVSANQQIDAAQAATNAAQLYLQAAEEKYKGGIGTTIDVTDAELTLEQARTSEVQARYNYNTALAALRAAVGEAAVEGLAP